MDALELQAALVKLDPATTVTPIGSNVNLVAQQQLGYANVNLDEADLTLQNGQQQVTTTANNTTASARKSSTQTHHHHHQTTGTQPLKCNLAEVR